MKRPADVHTDGAEITIPAVHARTGLPGTLTVSADSLITWTVEFTGADSAVVLNWQVDASDAITGTWAVLDGTDTAGFPRLLLGRHDDGRVGLACPAYPDHTLVLVAADAWQFAVAWAGAAE